MPYSFDRAFFSKWEVETTPHTAEPDGGSPFVYHMAFLRNEESLAQYVNTYSDVTGRLQQWFVTADDADSRMSDVNNIWTLDRKDALTPFPVVDNLVVSNTGVLVPGTYTAAFDDFPFVAGRKIFSMPPISSGIMFNSGTVKAGGFWLVFRGSHPDPIALTAYLRYCVHVHNN